MRRAPGTPASGIIMAIDANETVDYTRTLKTYVFAGIVKPVFIYYGDLRGSDLTGKSFTRRVIHNPNVE